MTGTVTTIQITGAETLRSKPTEKQPSGGNYLAISYLEDGSPKKVNAFGGVAKTYAGPGTYEAEFVQKGAYLNLNSLKLLTATKTTTTANGTQAIPVDANAVLREKSIITQVAFKGAIEVATQALAMGKKTLPEVDDFIIDLTGRLTTGLTNIIRGPRKEAE